MQVMGDSGYRSGQPGVERVDAWGQTSRGDRMPSRPHAGSYYYAWRSVTSAATRATGVGRAPPRACSGVRSVARPAGDVAVEVPVREADRRADLSRSTVCRGQASDPGPLLVGPLGRPMKAAISSRSPPTAALSYTIQTTGRNSGTTPERASHFRGSFLAPWRLLEPT